MTNANPYLPPRRRPATNPAAGDAPQAPPDTPTPTGQATPAPDVRVPAQAGSSRARQLRAKLRQRDGFFTALQTAELLQPPVSLRRPER